MTRRHPCEFYMQMAEQYKKKYDDLTNKIHEKIESLDNMMLNDFLIAHRKNVFDQIQVLKSLLEHEKR